MRPYGSQQSLERRRRRALALLGQGVSPREVARRLRASVGSVYRWQRAWATGGDVALAAKPVPGAPCKLTAPQRARLVQRLLQGARANGFPNELWTLKRIAAVIQVQFGVQYHPAHVWKLWRGLGWSCQVPEGRAMQRDERAIAP
jgi:transposase